MVIIIKINIIYDENGKKLQDLIEKYIKEEMESNIDEQ